jgi:hypothetical protein
MLLRALSSRGEARSNLVCHLLEHVLSAATCHVMLPDAPCLPAARLLTAWPVTPVPVVTTVSSLSVCTAHALGGGGVLHEGCGVVVAFGQLGFFGHPWDMCPCCLQKKHCPSAMRHCFSSLLSGFQVLMASTSIVSHFFLDYCMIWLQTGLLTDTYHYRLRYNDEA